MAVGQIAPAVLYSGKPLRFSMAERPYYSGDSAMVSLRSVCLAVGIAVRRRSNGHWTLIRGSDRLDFSVGDCSYAFNGANEMVRSAPEAHGAIVFIPCEMIQPMSGGCLTVHAELAMEAAPNVYFHDRLLRFRPADAPFRQSGQVFVPMRPTASSIGARVEPNRDGVHVTIVRSLDRLTYEEGSRWYLFNGAQRWLRTESVVRRKSVFVPIDLFQAIVGDELRAR